MISLLAIAAIVVPFIAISSVTGRVSAGLGERGQHVIDVLGAMAYISVAVGLNVWLGSAFGVSA